MKHRDVRGMKFGKLTALYRVGTRRYPSGGTLSVWHCVCECGNETEITLSALQTGNTVSCGCVHQESARKLHLTHGESHTRLHTLWKQMKKRCNNPHDPSYRWYGALGVSVCEEWEESFPCFKEWMLANGYDINAPRGKFTIDRIDPSGDYSPANCRLISIQAQQQNKRRSQHGIAH